MSNKCIENIISDCESLQNLNELKLYIKSLVPFVGAGMSVSMGYKTWYDFLNFQIESLANDPISSTEAMRMRCKLNNGEYLTVASEINIMLNDNLYSAVRREFSPKGKKDAPAYISYFRKMGCSTVLTTNYDNILESHMYIKGIKPEKVLPYSSYDIIKKDKQGKPLVVKLHGTFDNPSSIVLTKEQYEDKYVQNKEISETLQYYWTSKVLLFVGCSLERDYLVEFISQLANKDKIMYHYAIIQYPENDADRRRKTVELDRLKIRPIWYPSGKHNYVLDILKYLESSNDALNNTIGNKQTGNKSMVDFLDICVPFLDSIAVACRPSQRNKLFYSILNTDSKLKKKHLVLSTIANEIYQTKKKNALCIYGEPGTGKSTLLTLLYLELVDNCDIFNSYIPIYIDLHYYEQWLLSDAINDLSENIDKLRAYISTQPKRGLLLVDGLDEYPRHNKTLAEYIFKFAKEDSYVTKVVYSVGNITNRLLPRSSRLPDFPRAFERIIKLNLINTQESLFYQITEHLLRIYNILPKNTERSKVTDKIRNLTNMASGNYTDFRTINFLVLQYKKRSEILDQAIGDIYTEYFTSLSSKGIDGLAEQVSKLITGQDDEFETNEIVLLYKSASIRNFMYAHHYMRTIADCNREGLRLFDSIFPPCVNGFAKSIMNSDNRVCDTFVANSTSLYPTLTVKQQTQILYFLGRVKYRKDVATAFLLNEYNCCLEKIDSSSLTEHDSLMKFRTAGIALIYLGNRHQEIDFYHKLIYHPKLRKLNRLFHIDYYTNDEYIIGEDRNLEEIKCTKLRIERLYNSLYNSIINEPLKGQHSYYLSIITIINLVIYDHYRATESMNLYRDSKYGFGTLLEKLVKEKSITNHIIKNYLTSINSNWETSIRGLTNTSPIQDENVYNSFVLLFYRLKTIIRSGWLKSGRRVDLHQQPESVADHSWACGLIAMLLLSEDINMCSFMQNENLDEYKKYSKLHILELLLVHDLAESYTGDIIGDSTEKSKMEKEFISKIKTYDSFPYLRSFHRVSSLIEEYSMCQTINARIAYDIDKLEPLIQIFIYKDILENPSYEISEWESSVDTELETTIGRKIYEFILMNVEH